MNSTAWHSLEQLRRRKGFEHVELFRGCVRNQRGPGKHQKFLEDKVPELLRCTSKTRL